MGFLSIYLVLGFLSSSFLHMDLVPGVLALYLSIPYLGSANINSIMFSIPLDHW